MTTDAQQAWDELDRELDAWSKTGRTAEFWWRDDDAATVTPALEQLIALHRKHATPLMLAVIPATADAALAARLAGEPGVTAVQHGWAHTNHARPGRGKAELGDDRPAALVLGELARGALALDTVLDRRWRRILVPPYNRIAAPVAAGLAAAGYIGLSTDKPRKAPPPGVSQVNVHIDIMNWAGRVFLGEAACVRLATGHLRDKREGRADPGEATGLLTHHLAHDAPAWAFVDVFLGHLAARPGSRWRTTADLFAPAQSAA